MACEPLRWQGTLNVDLWRKTRPVCREKTLKKFPKIEYVSLQTVGRFTSISKSSRRDAGPCIEALAEKLVASMLTSASKRSSFVVQRPIGDREDEPFISRWNPSPFAFWHGIPPFLSSPHSSSFFSLSPPTAVAAPHQQPPRRRSHPLYPLSFNYFPVSL